MSEEDKNLNSAISGQLLSSWLPYGAIRRLIFAFLLLLAVSNFINNDNFYGFIFVFLASFMSPRIVGEVLYFFGRIAGFIFRRR